jgi:hypothetical protein
MSDPITAVDPAPGLRTKWFSLVLDPHLVLALSVLAALVGVSETFSFYPPKLAGTQAADMLTTLRDLTIMAFTFFFQKQANK